VKVLDLFSGIGGFSLGLHRAGMQTVAFCEINPFCRQVLAKHWPEVPIYHDIRTLTAARLAADGVVPDIICGGFPCQDLSVAGKGVGLTGARSGLWFEFLRIIAEVGPRWCIIENVPALRTRGLDTVLGGLAAIGYDAEWHCIPAAALGAPHRRDRVWIVAYANSGRHATEREPVLGGSNSAQKNGEADFAFAKLATCDWATEPSVGRVAARVPRRVDRLRALGNAVVPQIPEAIGRAIMAAEAGP